MIIKIVEPYRPTESFGNLLEGQTFMWEDGIFMKVKPSGVCNVVSLRDGNTLICKCDLRVTVVDCEVTVRYRNA